MNMVSADRAVHLGQRAMMWRPEGNTLGRPTLRLEDNIKISLREVRWKGVNWIHVAQERENWRAVLNMESILFRKKNGPTATLS
jgi:hypothetical protein